VGAHERSGIPAKSWNMRLLNCILHAAIHVKDNPNELTWVTWWILAPKVKTWSLEEPCTDTPFSILYSVDGTWVWIFCYFHSPYGH
jgi:hypothetical protein